MNNTTSQQDSEPTNDRPTKLKTLRNRVAGNDEWLAHARRLYLEENRRNGQYARELREAAGVSIREVARRMGVSAMMLSDLERGNRNWTAAMISKWEAAMSSENAEVCDPGSNPALLEYCYPAEPTKVCPSCEGIDPAGMESNRLPCETCHGRGAIPL